jgi:hypothetical protein
MPRDGFSFGIEQVHSRQSGHAEFVVFVAVSREGLTPLSGPQLTDANLTIQLSFGGTAAGESARGANRPTPDIWTASPDSTDEQSLGPPR